MLGNSNFTLFYQEKKPYVDKAAELKAEYVKSMESVNDDDAGNNDNDDEDKNDDNDDDKIEEVSCKVLSFSVKNSDKIHSLYY